MDWWCVKAILQRHGICYSFAFVPVQCVHKCERPECTAYGGQQNIIQWVRHRQLAAFMHATEPTANDDGPQITSSESKQFLWVFNILILAFCDLRPIKGTTIRRNSIYDIRCNSVAALIWFRLLIFPLSLLHARLHLVACARNSYRLKCSRRNRIFRFFLAFLWLFRVDSFAFGIFAGAIFLYGRTFRSIWLSEIHSVSLATPMSHLFSWSWVISAFASKLIHRIKR